MKIPWDFDDHRNMCIDGEIMITTPLRRDCKKEMKAEGRMVGKNLGTERQRADTSGNTREGGETK